jgi:hypothetical protein
MRSQIAPNEYSFTVAAEDGFRNWNRVAGRSGIPKWKHLHFIAMRMWLVILVAADKLLYGTIDKHHSPVHIVLRGENR